MKKELICINCPMGCCLEVTCEGGKITCLKGNECPRGKDYAAKEMSNPERVVTTTVRIKGASLPVLPVKTGRSIPKELGAGIVKAASKITVNAPVKSGDVIIKDILGTGVNLIATRTMERA